MLPGCWYACKSRCTFSYFNSDISWSNVSFPDFHLNLDLLLWIHHSNSDLKFQWPVVCSDTKRLSCLLIVGIRVLVTVTTQKLKFSIKDISSKYDQIRSFLQISSHLLKKSLMKNFIFLCSDWESFRMLHQRISPETCMVNFLGIFDF